MRQLRVLIDDRVPDQVQRLQCVQILQLDVQLRDLVVPSIYLTQTLQLLYST